MTGPNFKDCDDNGCVKRHPKTCKNFERNGKCRFKKCAYSHDKEGNNLKIEILENQVVVLKQEIEDIKKKKHYELESERKYNSEQFTKLSNTLDDVVARLSLIENDQTNHIDRETNVEEIPREFNIERMKAKIDKVKVNTHKINNKKGIIRTLDKESNKCDQCDFKSNKEITLSKHMNTKHAEKVIENDTELKICQSSEFECASCKDRVNTNKELGQHIAEHIEEIENTDIESLTNGHDLFECNLCGFESGHKDSVKEHLIEHVNPPKVCETSDESGYEGSVKKQSLEHTNDSVAVDTAEQPSHRLIDEYDDAGNYIGDDPRFM